MTRTLAAERRRARVVAVVLVGAVALPGLLSLAGVEHDDFPLSTYPMFARARPQVSTLHGAVAVAPDGTERRLSPQTIAGSPEPLQAVALVARAVRSGAEADRLCAAITGRVDPDDTVAVLLVEERVDAVTHYVEGAGARQRDREVRCEVEP